MNRGFAQEIYETDASHVETEIREGQLKMGSPGLKGKEIRINNRYMTLNGKPIIPVMGEIHFSRLPRAKWEDVILKMKACGVNIIASYVIWIHHEEIEGQFDWSGNKDLRAFAELCKKHQLWFYPRIGPWSHAEVRNGGTPDWLISKKGVKLRAINSVYQQYAEEWYRQIALQLKGLMYKDGGPVIGVQLENEYGYGKAGEPYILWLKKTAQKYGIDVPMYTVTGWDNGSVPAYEVIPLWGAYPDEPWALHLNRTEDCTNFQFMPVKENGKTGNDVKQSPETYIDYSAYPYFTCEMGMGIENTEHRRLQIGKIDGLGLVMAKLGSGSNLLGYYMFAGGSNPHGLLTSMEETKSSGSYNTNPAISYDFQAAIRETGELNDSYYEIKKLHYFLNEFGERLAVMSPVFPDKTNGLQYAVRANENSAFLFGINYCRNQKTQARNNIQFRVKLKDGEVTFPAKPISLTDSSMFIWPVNFKINDLVLKYATAQPLCKIPGKDLTNWIFAQDAAAAPEFCFSDKGIKSIRSANGDVEHKKGYYLISDLKPGLRCVITVNSLSGKKHQILLLSKEDAKQAWLFNENNHKSFYLSKSGIYANEDSLHFFGNSNHIAFRALNNVQINWNDKPIKSVSDGLFKSFSFDLKEAKPTITYMRENELAGATILKTSMAEVNQTNMLFRKFFVKSITLNNPAEIKSACLYLFATDRANIKINNLQVNQELLTQMLNKIDLTGYLKKGLNKIIADFPASTGNKLFAAKIVVNYQNNDQEIMKTDTTWQTIDQYTYDLPEPLSLYSHAAIVDKQLTDSLYDPAQSIYRVQFKDNTPSQVEDYIINIKYKGDKGFLYAKNRLVEDDFYNGNDWRISLSHIGIQRNGTYNLILKPLKTGDKRYFDTEAPVAGQPAVLKALTILPQYGVTVKVIP